MAGVATAATLIVPEAMPVIALRLDGFTLAGRPIETVVLGVEEPERVRRLEARLESVERR